MWCSCYCKSSLSLCVCSADPQVKESDKLDQMLSLLREEDGEELYGLL